MSFKLVTIYALIAFANAGYLESGLRYAAPAPIAYRSYVSPAVTKTDFIPGSYSSSYRSDVITPRVQYTETPGYSYAVPQPPAIAYAPTVTKVAHLEPIVRALPAIAPAPIARVGYAGAASFALGGHGLGYARALPLAHNGLALGGFARGLPLGHSTYGGYY
ncbi:hypothetical protein PPYR_06217 [Photinus pyralis]|uniref:Uncharacterized protein n=2 Tax=Photinus pyralis TaxID=7054 RepID=A0A5N4AT24_PHOPY|nr:cuticle protein 65-like [Photinus pyralis]XP_031338125.1 cuticle protein 65-like [Photinus pyralis]XP_031338126.1 cuticle protein 65-like [Photinus pyralis]XP_031338127.1 cuticle protein 65-like [Photinus pyralis]XP_031338508.1 cuticle protein 65-like [Photinus pyralis]XP_031338509.1 cuticle protein 65-like [Photinus pyralis]XP_031338510.1 cuticle protein 65-like [Photinus pyralis]KAB0800477.1 hypothetical protein PPYR_06217 [Photinus pyralis]